MWWQRKGESNASCQLSLPPTPHPYSHAPLLHNKLPQNLTAWNNQFFMLTNWAGQGFGQSTVTIVYVCSAISRLSTGKTPQLRQPQQLGVESSGDTFTHISGGWCWLSTETQSPYKCPLHKVAWASGQLRAPTVWVSLSMKWKLHRTFHLAVKIMKYSTGYKRVTSPPEFQEKGHRPRLSMSNVKTFAVFFFFFNYHIYQLHPSKAKFSVSSHPFFFKFFSLSNTLHPRTLTSRLIFLLNIPDVFSFVRNNNNNNCGFKKKKKLDL